MRGSLDLNGKWGVTYADDFPDYFTGPAFQGRHLIPANVPAPIHQVLMDAGMLEDPRLGMNSLRARWVEEQFWIYRRTFELAPEAAENPAWLTFARLECCASILLNGEEIGKHANAHRPARFNVTGKLRAGENLLVVLIEAGLYATLDKPGAEYAIEWSAKLTKRPWLRKPQYQFGWDWQQRLINVGILGDVRLEWGRGPRLDDVSVFAVPAADLKTAALTVRATVEGVAEGDVEAALRARIVETGQEVMLPLSVSKGEKRVAVSLEMTEPRLWWPIGHGEQALYTVEVTLASQEETQTVTRRTGVRRVEIDQSPHPVEGLYCILKINDRPIFCKGGNWVPADMLYSSVTEERYRKLVELAVEANFNLLRIWGGGAFADHGLCDACDEAGVLLWHDFLFACAKYPGDWPDFTAEVRAEVTHAVRDLAHHPCLAVWCGNNEVEWGDWEWAYDGNYRTHPHYALFHHDIPKIVLEEDPSKVHWLSSPWSPNYGHPNSPTVGDQHPWGVSLIDPGGADFWNYRKYVDRFPNEGGVLGASSPATIRQFTPESERFLLSPTWVHHDNPFAATSDARGEEGRAYKTVRIWTGRDPFGMEWDEYAFVSGLLQAEGLQEYISNYRRRMFSSASAIFWMYNDSWPVTHGWTIVDYFLRKKLAFHPVRRACQPITVVVADDGDAITVYGINDTPNPWTGEVRYGLFGLSGELLSTESIPASLPANAATPLQWIDRTAWEKLGFEKTGAFALLSEAGKTVAQHRLLLARFKDLEFAPAKIELSLQDGLLTLLSGTFCWGVCLDIDGEIPLGDNCFDLIPGVPYTVPWNAAAGEPRVARVGNGDAIPG